MEMFILAIILIVVLGILAYAYRLTRKKALPEGKKRFYKEKIAYTHSLSDREAIIECDKILAHILSDYGYTGTVADQLKQKPKTIPSLEEAWRLHKLRNRIVHEMGNAGIHQSDRTSFESLLLDLLR